MALPLLVNGGAECGPINPLQGLSKRFQSDRGIQQDQFVTGRAGSSRQTFRTTAHGLDQSLLDETARFFGPAQAPSFSAGPSTSLASPISGVALGPSSQTGSKGWASDFLISSSQMGLPSQHQVPASIIQQSDFALEFLNSHHVAVSQEKQTSFTRQGVQSPTHYVPVMQNRMQFHPPMNISAAPQQTVMDTEAITEAINQLQLEQQQARQVEELQHRADPVDMDELARTAGMLVDSLKAEENPKFKNSSFMSLMRSLRDRESVVEGNVITTAADGTSWAAEFTAADPKGKGKAREVPIVGATARRKSVHFVNRPDMIEEDTTMPQDPIETESELDKYFREENGDLQGMWSEHDNARLASRNPIASQSDMTDQHREAQDWAHLQADWDHLEATASGIKAVDFYAFQVNNPYYMYQSAMPTRHHSFHHAGLHEGVLQKEAAVQRDPKSAQAWFELGVKQQENERELKAIQALNRAVELDPTLLDAWLALAISYTNESQHGGAYDAIEQWVDRNPRYTDVVNEIKRQRGGITSTFIEKREDLLHCLVEMVRSVPGGEVDAETQVVLAVLLNTTEDYGRAQDCFKAALAVRPDDWLLYNRVGATLANSGRAAEAVEYYYRALELHPTYIRARFNLGISCVNLRRYDEAAQHILDALVLQEMDSAEGPQSLEVTRGVTSSALWESLKTTCFHLQRADVASLCDERNLAAVKSALMGQVADS